MNDIALDAACDTMFARLVDGKPTELAGLGEVSIKPYAAYAGRDPRSGKTVEVPAKRRALFRVAAEARAQLDTRGAPARTDFGALVGRAAAGELVVVGALGLLRVVHAWGASGRDPETGTIVEIPSRSVIAFRASRTLEAALDGNRPATIAEKVVTELMAMPVAIAPPARSALARMPATWPVIEDLDSAQAVHEAICEQRGVEPGKVFAAVTEPDADPDSVDLWALVSRDRDPIVVRTRGNRSAELRLSGWLGATQVLARLATLARDRVLAPGDLRRLVARLDAAAPGVVWAWPALPF